jgi:DMSO/TMAO reductase YedYZ molybdopterin-dependent catalytic subunit
MSEMRTPLDAEQPIRVGRGVFLGLAGMTAGVVGLGAAGKFDLSGLNPASWLTPGASVNGFTIYTITNGYPRMEPSQYRLRVDGLVDEPREYSYNELLSMQAVEETRYYQCVTGWVVPKPRWHGVRLWDLVQASKPKASGTALHFSCFDGAYTESLTFKQAQNRDVLLAYGLDNKPLAVSQGFPIRLVVPGMFGYKYAKWVNQITVMDQVVPGYWEQNGYEVNAYIGTSGLS